MFQEQTKPLMRPNQVRETKEEANRIESMLQAPPHIANQLQDRGELHRQLRSLKSSLEHQAPKPYREEELDAATAREKELRAAWLEGMPTQAEMRRNPAGARDKHMKWESRNKGNVLEWKNIKRRLHANGYGDVEETDIANIEVHRPRDAGHELNMHSEQIAGKLQFGPEPGAGRSVVFSSQETEALKALDPDLAGRLAMMNNDQRALVKDFIANLHSDDVPVQTRPRGEIKRKGRKWTPEQRAAFGQKMKAAREAKKQEG